MKQTVTPAIKVLNNKTVRNYYVCGGINGMFLSLMKSLRAVGFDQDQDVLISTGNLSGKEEMSLECLKLLKEPWFESVIGSNDIDALSTALHPKIKGTHHRASVGELVDMISDCDTKLMASLIQNLPYAIEVHHQGGKFGIVHADVLGNSWGVFREKLLKENTFPPSSMDQLKKVSVCVYNNTIFSSVRFKTPSKKIKPISGMDAVFCGHNVTQRAMVKQNIFYVDTGGLITNKILLLKLDREIFNSIPPEMPF